MGIKNKTFFLILLFFTIFMVYAENNNWYDSVLRNNYTDHQISYWAKIVVDAKQNSKPIIKSESEYVYIYNGFVINENRNNLTGKFSMEGIPTVNYEIKCKSTVSALLFISKNSDITLQIWGHDKRLYSINYYRNKYQYNYFEDGEVSYSFDVGK